MVKLVSLVLVIEPVPTGADVVELELVDTPLETDLDGELEKPPVEELEELPDEEPAEELKEPPVGNGPATELEDPEP